MYNNQERLEFGIISCIFIIFVGFMVVLQSEIRYLSLLEVKNIPYLTLLTTTVKHKTCTKRKNPNKKTTELSNKISEKIKPSKRSAEQDKSRKKKNLRLLEQRAYLNNQCVVHLPNNFFSQLLKQNNVVLRVVNKAIWYRKIPNFLRCIIVCTSCNTTWF